MVDKNAAKMVKDTEMKEKFWNTLSEICENEDLRTEMAQNLEFFDQSHLIKDFKSFSGITPKLFLSNRENFLY